MQDHPVIEILVDPAAHACLISAKSSTIPRLSASSSSVIDGPAVVAMQMLALAVVVQQTMAVAEVDFTADAKHGGPRGASENSVNGRVVHFSLGERGLAFRAFVAVPAMETARRSDAGKVSTRVPPRPRRNAATLVESGERAE